MSLFRSRFSNFFRSARQWTISLLTRRRSNERAFATLFVLAHAAREKSTRLRHLVDRFWIKARSSHGLADLASQTNEGLVGDSEDNSPGRGSIFSCLRMAVDPMAGPTTKLQRSGRRARSRAEQTRVRTDEQGSACGSAASERLVNLRSFASPHRMARLFGLLVLLFAIPLTAFARTPNDTHLDEQWYLDAISAYDAWDAETGDRDVVVAVLDSGVDLEHPDLEGQIWENEDEVAGDRLDNDQNGFVDDVNGWDFIEGDNDPQPNDFNGRDEGAQIHGTLIAGIIGAIGNNDEGVAGVAWRVSILPVRMLDGTGSGDTRAAAAAISYAVDAGANIINMSFTGFNTDSVLEAAVERAYEHGVLIVAAMGNGDGGGHGIDTDERPIYPVCLEDGEDWVLGVAALTEEFEKADFSNYGRNCTDVSAPGVNIFGALYTDGTTLTDEYGGEYDGTSVAAPQVAGVAALLLAHYPTLSVEDLQSAIQLSVNPILTRGTEYAGKLGAGMVNAAQALEVAGQFAESEETEGTNGTEGTEDVEEITVVGAAKGSAPLVKVFTETGALISQWEAYAHAFTGGVFATAGDIDGDGVMEVITGAGAGGGPHVRVFEQDGTLIGQFFAYDTAFTGGVNVAAGDIDGDGDDEIITGAGIGGGPQVRVFDGALNVVGQFFAFDSSRRFGVVVSVRDMGTGDGDDEIIAREGLGGSLEVRIFQEDDVK